MSRTSVVWISFIHFFSISLHKLIYVGLVVSLYPKPSFLQEGDFYYTFVRHDGVATPFTLDDRLSPC